MLPGILSSGGRPGSSAVRAWLVLCAMSMLQFFIAVDVTVVNIALPSIGAEFEADGHTLTWVVVGYTVTGGGMLMLGGRLGDLLGRRRVLLLGTGLFGAASLLAGLAPTFSLLVVARLAQGAGEAIALPAAMAVVVLTFPEGPRRTRALGVWAAVASCGLVLGFVLSGFLTAHLGWRWIFLVSVPLVLVVKVAAVLLVERDRPLAAAVRRGRGWRTGDARVGGRGRAGRGGGRRGRVGAGGGSGTQPAAAAAVPRPPRPRAGERHHDAAEQRVVDVVPAVHLPPA